LGYYKRGPASGLGFCTPDYDGWGRLEGGEQVGGKLGHSYMQVGGYGMGVGGVEDRVVGGEDRVVGVEGRGYEGDVEVGKVWGSYFRRPNRRVCP